MSALPNSLLKPNFERLNNTQKFAWEVEQMERARFWHKITSDMKAEFILGQGFVYETLVYGKHWKIHTNLCQKLITFVYENNLGELGCQREVVRLTRNDYQPDVCLWTTERVNKNWDTQKTFPPPNLIMEIIMPSSQERDRGVKFEDYALHGVEEYWLLDIEAQQIEQYLLTSEQRFQLNYIYFQGSMNSDLLPGLTLDLKEIFI